MSKVKKGDKVWLLRIRIDCVKVIPVEVVCDDGDDFNVKGPDGWHFYVHPWFLYRKHAEAMQAALDTLTEAHPLSKYTDWE